MGGRFIPATAGAAEGLQRFFDALNFCKPLVDDGDFGVNKLFYVVTGFFVFGDFQFQQLVNFVERKTDFFGADNKADSVHICLGVEAIPSFTALPRRNQAVLFVKMQGVSGDAGKCGKLADL